MSRTPARTRGWLATIPTVRPPSRASAHTMLRAHCAWSSMNSPWSAISAITWRTSYGFLGSAGTMSRSRGQRRSGGSVASPDGGSSPLFEGSSEISCRTAAKQAASSS